MASPGFAAPTESTSPVGPWGTRAASHQTTALLLTAPAVPSRGTLGQSFSLEAPVCSPFQPLNTHSLSPDSGPHTRPPRGQRGQAWRWSYCHVEAADASGVWRAPGRGRCGHLQGTA